MKLLGYLREKKQQKKLYFKPLMKGSQVLDSCKRSLWVNLAFYGGGLLCLKWKSVIVIVKADF